MRSAPYATRRERDVNHGDRTPIRGSESKTLAWISVEQAQASPSTQARAYLPQAHGSFRWSRSSGATAAHPSSVSTP